MQAARIRVRLGPAFEWLVAAAFLLATFGVGMLLVRELSAPPPATRPARVVDTASEAPPAVPERAVSVPALMLMDGAQVRVGDSADKVSRLLGPASEVGKPSVEQGLLGERVIRTYEKQGTRFMLVLEPFERNGAPRVAGIYLQ